MLLAFEALCQANILITDMSCSYLSGSKATKWRRFAGAIGIAAQPFWIAAAWIDHQWGLLLLSFWYSVMWIGMFINSKSEAQW